MATPLKWTNHQYFLCNAANLFTRTKQKHLLKHLSLSFFLPTTLEVIASWKIPVFWFSTKNVIAYKYTRIPHTVFFLFHLPAVECLLNLRLSSLGSLTYFSPCRRLLNPGVKSPDHVIHFANRCPVTATGIRDNLLPSRAGLTCTKIIFSTNKQKFKLNFARS